METVFEVMERETSGGENWTDVENANCDSHTDMKNTSIDE
jgi:hypothetical protein